MSRPLHFNAFLMNTGSHIQHGQWRHPDARQAEFNDVGLWIELAGILEEGVPRRDVLRRCDRPLRSGRRGLHGNAARRPADSEQRPGGAARALAVHTQNIGLAYTSNTMQNHPFNFARQASTLDHISNGRIAWNIVTGTQENSARNFGLPALAEHDDPVRRGPMSTWMWSYKLWEGSWDEGALLKDRDREHTQTRQRSTRSDHEGLRYKVAGPHLPSPSPQRTPLLFQAGGSARGSRFAAQHAEAVFLGSRPLRSHSDTSGKPAPLSWMPGRQPEDIELPGLSFVVGATPAEVQRKESDYLQYASVVGHPHRRRARDPAGRHPGGLPEDTPLKGRLRTTAGQGARGLAARGHPRRRTDPGRPDRGPAAPRLRGRHPGRDRRPVWPTGRLGRRGMAPT